MDSACDGLYDEWVEITKRLAATPALRAKYAAGLATSMELIRQADRVRGAYRVTDPARCGREISALYDQIGDDLRYALYGESKDHEFPWRPMITMTRGLHLSDFVDHTGQRKPDILLANAARQALRLYWELRPVGSETPQMLEDRIVSVFVERYGLNWNKDVSPADFIGDVRLSDVVADVSPLSIRRGPGNVHRAAAAGPMDWLSLALIGLGVGAAVHFAAKNLGKKGRK